MNIITRNTYTFDSEIYIIPTLSLYFGHQFSINFKWFLIEIQISF